MRCPGRLEFYCRNMFLRCSSIDLIRQNLCLLFCSRKKSMQGMASAPGITRRNSHRTSYVLALLNALLQTAGAALCAALRPSARVSPRLPPRVHSPPHLRARPDRLFPTRTCPERSQSWVPTTTTRPWMGRSRSSRRTFTSTRTCASTTASRIKRRERQCRLCCRMYAFRDSDTQNNKDIEA